MNRGSRCLRLVWTRFKLIEKGTKQNPSAQWEKTVKRKRDILHRVSWHRKVNFRRTCDKNCFRDTSASKWRWRTETLCIHVKCFFLHHVYRQSVCGRSDRLVRQHGHLSPKCARMRSWWAAAAAVSHPRPSYGLWCTPRSRGCMATRCGCPVPWTGTPSSSRPSAKSASSCHTCSRCGRWWVRSRTTA